MRICIYALDAVAGGSGMLPSQMEAHAVSGPQIREGYPQ
jgi:hypothetical protein